MCQYCKQHSYRIRTLCGVQSLNAGLRLFPQSILATVYFAENYGQVLEHEDDLGIGLPVTAIYCIFSLGSVVIVLITVLKAMWSKPDK